MKYIRERKFLLLSAILIPSLSLSAIKASAQNPGGVSAPEVWFKTMPVTSNLQGYYRWQDFGGDSVTLNNYSSSGPLSGGEATFARSTSNYMRTYNFNPAIYLSAGGSNTNKEVLLSKTNLEQGTIIGVWGASYTGFDQDMVLYSINGRPGDGIIMTKNIVDESIQSGKSPLDYGSTEGMDLMYHANAPGKSSEPTINKFEERDLRVQSYYRINRPNYNDVWGERQRAVISVAGNYNTPSNNINNNSTFNTSNFNNALFYGYTPEVIVYNRLLTLLERRKVETYLALKYAFSLEASYISSKNRLMWDYAADSGFDTRITGINRDDASGLYQPISTTSYEDSPYYSDNYNGTYDSYYQNNSYNRSSNYRLLVMGRPYGTNMADGEFTIWGDDNQSFRVPTTGARVIGGITTMSRDWKVCTNVPIPPNSAVAQQGLWSTNGLNIAVGVNNATVLKSSTDTSTTGTAVTTQPLSGQNGYFSWVYGEPLWGSVTIKFGTQNPTIQSGQNDYGYFINNSGQIYPITGGVQSSSSIASIGNGQKIEIEKKANIITLWVAGSPQSQTIVIATADSLKTYYGTLLLTNGSGTGATALTAFTANGFYYGNSGYNSNGGHRLELSYDQQRAGDFSNYSTPGLAYLIVDRSGTGTYPLSSTDYYASDDQDGSRTKIIFDNIQWDTSVNDIFTFGYILSGKLAISVDSINTTCDGSTANQDGFIKINILSGLLGINYSIVNTSDTSVKYSGRTFEDSLQVDSLPVGTYDISMSEIGGYNFQSSSTGSFRTSAYSNAYQTWSSGDFSLSFLAGTKDSAAAAGFSAVVGGTSLPPTGYNLPGYGVYKEGASLYPIVQNVVSLSPVTDEVQPGDSITVEIKSNNMLIKVNGSQISSSAIASADQTLFYPAIVTLPDSIGSELDNLNLSFGSSTWQTSTNMTEVTSTIAKTTATATISADCSAEPAAASVPTTTTASATAINPLSVYYKNPSNMMHFTAKITLNVPGISQIVVFNMGGQLVYRAILNGSATTQSTDITVPISGVYIVKAITPQGEFSQKVLAH